VDRTSDPRWWREEAKRLRGVSERYRSFETLQRSFSDLAIEYGRIADLLERQNQPAA
jgi:hypothetical protein